MQRSGVGNEHIIALSLVIKFIVKFIGASKSLRITALRWGVSTISHSEATRGISAPVWEYDC